MLAFRGAGDEPPQREAPAGSHLSRYSHRSLAPSAPITLISFVQKQQSFRKEPNTKNYFWLIGTEINHTAIFSK
jgi:hypothetical protein